MCFSSLSLFGVVKDTFGGFLFSMFPDQEPCVRDFTTRCDRRISVDISVGVDDDAVLGVGVHGQGVNLGVSLGVGIVVGSPPLASLDSWGARLISGSLMTEITIYPLAEVLPLIHTLYYFLLLLLFNDNDNDADDGNFDGTRRNPRRFIQGHTFSRP